MGGIITNMAFLQTLLGSFASTGAGDVLKGAGQLAKDIKEIVTGEMSPDKKAEILQKAQELETASLQGQMAINQAEANSSSFFVAGWRPSIGWVCSISMACYFIPQYLLASIFWIKLSWATNTLVPFPIAEPKGMMELVYALLGFGLYRTVEKMTGKAR
jgi:hypothetical protein